MRLGLAICLCLALDFGCGPQAASGPVTAPAPKKNHSNQAGPKALPPLNERERALVAELKADVEHLSGKIGERNATKKWELADTADWLVGELEHAGYPVERQGYEAGGIAAQNLIVDVGGRIQRDTLVVIGAHYDSAEGSPGADDNASGVAALLALARRFRNTKPARTLRFAFFSLEEPPYFQTQHMGSQVFAKSAAARGDKIAMMLSIESIGYYSQAPGSQHYPEAISATHPTTADFLAVVGNPESGALVDGVVTTLRERGSLPVEGATLSEDVAGWSDHWSFWQIGVSAAMITDTAPFRNPHYHRASDTIDRLDFERMARAVAGLEHVVAELTGVARAGGKT
jgi:hypothetical protein